MTDPCPPDDFKPASVDSAVRGTASRNPDGAARIEFENPAKAEGKLPIAFKALIGNAPSFHHFRPRSHVHTRRNLLRVGAVRCSALRENALLPTRENRARNHRGRFRKGDGVPLKRTHPRPVFAQGAYEANRDGMDALLLFDGQSVTLHALAGAADTPSLQFIRTSQWRE